MPETSPPSAPRERQHLYWLDWVRFLAAFGVLAAHTREFNWDGFAAYTGQENSPALALFISLFSLGRQAVVVFFVLSGWLVGGYAIERVRAGTFDLAGYAADRLSRVYVPLVPALLFTLAVVRGLDAPVDLRQYLVCLVGLQNVTSIRMPGANGALWTLAYEIWFYVLTGCAAVACRRRGAGWSRLLGVAGAAVAVWVCVALGWVYLACWLVGAAGGWLRGRLSPGARPWVAAAGALVMAGGSAIYQIDKGVLPSPSAGFALPASGLAQLIVAAGALLLVASVSDLAPRTGVGRRIERAGGWLAAFSYTLYLVHFPVLGALRVCLGTLPPVMTAFAVGRALASATLCVVVALGLYALFERQTPQVRRWLRARFGGEASPQPRPAPAGAPALAART